VAEEKRKSCVDLIRPKAFKSGLSVRHYLRAHPNPLSPACAVRAKNSGDDNLEVSY